MKVAAFLTCDREAAHQLLGRLRARWPAAHVVAFANDEDREALAARHAEVEFRRDKPAGGKLAFVKALRREGFSHAAVAWHGGERFLPMRVVAVLVGCDVLAVDERCREQVVRLWSPWTWLPHLLRRTARTDPLQFARLLGACYRATIGVLVAAVAIPLRRCWQALAGR